MKIGFGGQYTDDALLNSEQSTVIGMDRISALTSGAISGDKIWYIRGELNRNFSLLNNLSITPYIYSAMGVAYLNRATVAENKQTAAKSAGVGFQLDNFNNYFFFDKNITAKFDFNAVFCPCWLSYGDINFGLVECCNFCNSFEQ